MKNDFPSEAILLWKFTIPQKSLTTSSPSKFLIKSSENRLISLRFNSKELLYDRDLTAMIEFNCVEEKSNKKLSINEMDSYLVDVSDKLSEPIGMIINQLGVPLFQMF